MTPTLQLQSEGVSKGRWRLALGTRQLGFQRALVHQLSFFIFCVFQPFEKRKGRPELMGPYRGRRRVAYNPLAHKALEVQSFL